MAKPTKTFRSKKEFAYEVLRENILSGELKPGTRLIIDELAKDLSVSTIPIREALQRLQADGFVAIEPYIGATVKELQIDLIQEVFELLTALEVISSRAACEKMTAENFDTLEALIRKMDEELDDLEAWSQDNVYLHQHLCEWANMSLTQTLMKRVVDHWDWLRRYYLESVFVHRVKGVQADHWMLLDALRTRDSAHVTAVVKAHNQKALAAYLEYLEANRSAL